MQLRLVDRFVGHEVKVFRNKKLNGTARDFMES